MLWYALDIANGVFPRAVVLETAVTTVVKIPAKFTPMQDRQ